MPLLFSCGSFASDLKNLLSLGLLSKNEVGEYSLADNFQAYCSIPEEILELYNLLIESYLLGKEKPNILNQKFFTDKKGPYLLTSAMTKVIKKPPSKEKLDILSYKLVREVNAR